MSDLSASSANKSLHWRPRSPGRSPGCGPASTAGPIGVGPASSGRVAPIVCRLRGRPLETKATILFANRRPDLIEPIDLEGQTNGPESAIWPAAVGRQLSCQRRAFVGRTQTGAPRPRHSSRGDKSLIVALSRARKCLIIIELTAYGNSPARAGLFTRKQGAGGGGGVRVRVRVRVGVGRATEEAKSERTGPLKVGRAPRTRTRSISSPRRRSVTWGPAWPPDRPTAPPTDLLLNHLDTKTSAT